MPRPGRDRLVGSSGDGIDLRSLGVSNTMRFCRSIRSLDDAYGIWEFPFGQILSVTGPRTAVLEGGTGNPVAGSLYVLDSFLNATGLSRSSLDLNLTPVAGTTIVFDDPTSRVVLGSAVVTSVTGPARGTDGQLQMVLTFDRDLPSNVTGAIAYAADPHYRAGNSLIERNTAQYMNGSMGTEMINSTVQGNYVREAIHSGIYHANVGDTYPPSSSLTLKNNVIDGVNTTHDQYSELAGIEFFAVGTWPPPTVGVHQHIAVTQNFIADPSYSAVWMGNVAGGSVTGNYFLDPNDSYTPPEVFCCSNPADLRLPVAVENSTNLTISNNTIDQTSGRMMVTDTQYNDLAAYAPGSTIRLSAYNLGKLANPSVTITDADGNTTAVPIQATATNSFDVNLPPQIGLGGAYLTLVSGTAKNFATLFVDSQDNIPALNGCTYFLSPSSVSIAAGAATIAVLVVTQPGCTYTLTPDTAGLSGSPSGSGTGVLSVSAAANNGPSQTLTFEIAGQAVTLTQAALTPAISAIFDPWTYTSGFAPGSWVTITGSNLASTAQTWNPQGAQLLPVTLGTTSVYFNGIAAPLQYVNPTQINALVPAGVAPGTVNVVLYLNGIGSAPASFTATPAQPSVYALPTTDASQFFVTAALAGTATYIGNSAVDPRVLRAAQPGDTLDLYMIGLGATEDPTLFITNSEFSEAAPVQAPVTVSLNSITAPVLFAGLTAPGLYLVRITIPENIPTGALTLQIAAGGFASKAPLFFLIE